MTARSTLILLVTGIIWGGSYLFIRVAVDVVSPLQLVLFRSVSGGGALLLLARLQHRDLGIDAYTLRFSVLTAIFGALIPFAMIAWAETHIDSGPASVLNATMPLFVIVFAATLLPDEKLGGERALGVGKGLLGVLVLVGGDVKSLASSSLLAQLAVLAASALYALSAIASRVVLRRWDAVSLSTVQVSLVAVFSAPLLLATETPRFDLGWDVWGSLLALGVLSTGAAYVAYYWLIENVGSVRASVVAYIIPIVGVAAGALVLGESVAWNTFVGGAVILLGVAIVNGALRWLPGRRAPVDALEQA